MKKYLLWTILYLCALGGRAQQVAIKQETFEGAGTDHGYTSNTFDRAVQEYFLKATVASGGTYANFPTNVGTTLTNQQGTNYWVAEGVRGLFDTGPEAGKPAGYVTMNPITNAASYKNFQVKIAFAAPRGAPTYTGPGNATVESNDRIRVQYSFDGNPFVTIGLFTGNGPIGGVNDWQQDTSSPLDSISTNNGASPVLGPAFQDITFALPTTAAGNSLRVRVVVDAQGGSEEVAFDNIRVTGEVNTVVRPDLSGIETTPISYTEGSSGAVQITNSLVVAYTAGTTLSSATVQIQGYAGTQDVLNFTNQNGITGSYSAGTLTLSGSASLAAYQAALRSITYQNTNSTTATGGARVIAFTVSAGSTVSNTTTRTINVTATLNAPAALPYTEDLETNGEGTRYTATTFDNTTASSGFFRATASPPVGPTGVTPTNSTFSNYSGSAYWFGEGAKSGGSPTPPVSTLQMAPVNAAGYADLRFTLRMGQGQGGQSNPWDNMDFVKLYYRANGGTWTLFGAFYGNNTTNELRQDTNLDGVAETTSPRLTSTLQDIVFSNIPNSAAVANLDFRIDVSSDASQEMAFDFIRITGTKTPTVTTDVPSSITANSAVLGGNVTADGGATVSGRGIVYSSTNTNPTVGGAGVTADANGSGTGTFSETIAGLTAGTTYYVAAYATNTAGTSYGVVRSFTTPTTVVSIVRAGTNPTNASSVSFTVTFANAVTGISTSNFDLTASGITAASVASVSGSGTTYTVTVNTGSGDGTIRLNLANATGISPGVSGLPFTGGETYTIDKTRPSVTISSTAGASGSTTTTSPIPFTVTFSENVNASFVQGDITVSNGTISGFTTVVAGTTFTFNVTPTTAGTATTVTVPANVAQDGAGNFNTAAPSSYSITYNVPNTTVASVTRLTPSPTATAQVSYRVVFAASVTGVSTSNFLVTGPTGSGVATNGISGSGTTYTVVVNTGTGNGTLKLDVQNGTGISPTVTNVPYTSGEQYSIIKTFGAAPQLSLRAAGSGSGTNPDVTAFVDLVQVLQSGTSTTVAGGVQNGSFETSNVAANSFLYQQNGVVAAPWAFSTQAGVSRNSSAFGSTAPAGAGDAVGLLQTASGISGSIAQNLAVPTGSYQVNFQAVQRSNNGASDQVVNVFLVEGSNTVFIGTIQPTSNTTYQSFTSAAFSVTAPALTATVSSTAAASGGTTNTTPIPFAVSFSQSVGTSFVDTDVTVSNGTITGGSFSGSGAGPYTFTVTPTTPGTATTVSLAAGVAQDANNTLNSASNAYSVTYNQPVTPAPVVTGPSNGATTNNTPTSAGTAVVGSTVLVYIDGVQVGTAVTPNSGGTWLRTYSGTALTSGTHTVYATAQLPGQLVSAPSATNTFTTVVPATYSSSAATQASTARVVAGSTNQAILQVAIVIGGGPDAPLSATSFSFTTNGSTNPADITAARVYYTGTSSTFATTNQFGSNVANPNGSFTIGGNRQLATGTNYFWLVYDVAPGATNGNVLDATAPSLTVGGTARTPSTPDPAGNRQIVRSTRVAGTALRFTGDATPGYVDFSASPNPAPLLNTGTGGAYSQVAWIKPATGTGSTTYYVLGNGTGNSAAPYLYVTGNGRLGAGFGTGTATFGVQTGPNTVTANEWHYVAATYTGGTLTIYLDGESVNSASASGTPAATRVNFVGNVAASGANNFPGTIDEVSQWNRALGQIELRRMRHLTLTGSELNLVSYMQFNDAGTTTLDVISNATGTLTGATRITSTAPVGSGTANLQVVAANTTYSFPDTNVSIAFTGVTGSSETVVFRLDGQPLGTQPSAAGLQRTYTPAYWIVDKYVGGTFTSANVTYTLTPADISAADAATPSNLKLFKRGSNADVAFDAPISATAANAPAGTVTFPVTSFSQTVIGTFGSSPLPVELTGFTAERQGDDALLQWTTASEISNDRFEVESSIDGRVFRKIGSVAGHGTTTKASSYQTTDLNVARYAAAQIYYRLRQVDTDGSSSFSPVRTVQVSLTEGLQAQLYPNPSHSAEALTLLVRAGAAGPASWQLTDMLGRVLRQETNVVLPAGASTLPVSAAELPTGVYLLKLQQGTHHVIRKLVRE